MDWASPYFGYVISAYGVVAVVLCSLLLASFIRSRSLKKSLAELQLPDVGARDETS